MFVLSVCLFLEFAGANPISNTNAHLTGSNSLPDCNDTHLYCCNPPLNSPSIISIFDKLSIAADTLGFACTNSTFMDNVSNYNNLVSLNYFPYSCSLH